MLKDKQRHFGTILAYHTMNPVKPPVISNRKIPEDEKFKIHGTLTAGRFYHFDILQ